MFPSNKVKAKLNQQTVGTLTDVPKAKTHNKTTVEHQNTTGTQTLLLI
jgi:hypothetical protein